MSLDSLYQQDLVSYTPMEASIIEQIILAAPRPPERLLAAQAVLTSHMFRKES